jgi:hypothetical protein
VSEEEDLMNTLNTRYAEAGSTAGDDFRFARSSPDLDLEDQELTTSPLSEGRDLTRNIVLKTLSPQPQAS